MLRIAVTGANGRIGGQVVALLADDPAHHVVAVARRDPPARRRPANVTWAMADYADPVALARAFAGVDVLVFVPSDGPVAQVLVHHRNVVEAATATAVGHVVALSGLDADQASPFCYAVSFGFTEQLLRDSATPVSIARASIYTEFFATFLTAARGTGQLRIPAGDGRISLVSVDDVGRCLATLAIRPPTGRTHDITGPDTPTAETVARLAERAWHAPVRYVDIPPGVFCAEQAEKDEDPWWVYAFSSMFASVRDQRWARRSDEVLGLTGRTPVSVAEVLARMA